jgi:polyhydroxybutyrate depolymerase
MVGLRGTVAAVVGVAVLMVAAQACGGPSADDVVESHDRNGGSVEADGGGTGQGPDDQGSDDGGGAGDSSPVVDAGNDGAPEKFGSSSGCGKTGAATGAQTVSMMVGGVQRSFIRFVPSTYAASKPMDLVLAFHGSGGTDDKTRTTFALESHANDKAIFVYPQGLPSTDPAFVGVNRWDPKMGSKDYAFVDAILDAIESAYCIERDKVFAAGFSNGAEFTTMLGCYRGDVLRAIATVAPGGTPIGTATCAGEVAVWGGVGTDDATHQAGATATRTHYVTADGCSSTAVATTPTGCQAYNGCRPEAPVVWCSYPGGHMWPPIAPAGVMGFFESFP